ncbi:pseudouridine synthase [Buchnera aphidicola (Nipponaphis monzeni)]|uniref:Pseudouridine synthase n=1 Tax=Buchnera aphidicola (Nipponaphis monzeni) TaxID=2495405 RepID=A0A455TAA6_9GAMM|nr:RluA family pseudouridine synthase [Buchnera aphidicola]BBI01276.1 pseudouridine synthase [Buchnera aphidicola (Nipponaphis monzeni)]
MIKMILPCIFKITKEMINQRIDNFLIKKFKNVPKSMIYRIIRVGKVQINKEKIKPSYKLKINDNIYLPYIKVQDKISIKKNIPVKIKNLLIKNILYEDKYLLVINKPSGIAVHGGSGLSFGIIEIFRQLIPSNNNLELVHRLDKDTSGILILSKKANILKSLHAQLRDKKIKKNYLALVHGKWPLEIKKVEFPLLKNNKRIVSINANGKPSKTCFKIQRVYSSSTLIAIQPITGRTHQIRVHTLSTGHPIIFDNRYGNKLLDNKIKISTEKKLLLHANNINFVHPHNQKKICINAPLEKHFLRYINELK